MGSLQTFYIWDEDAERATKLQDLLIKALDACNVSNQIFINSEPPMLARHGMTGYTPAVQYNEKTWYCKNKNINEAGISELVAKMLLD